MARRSSIAHVALGALAALACACAPGASGSPATAGSSSRPTATGAAPANAPANVRVGREIGDLAPDFEAKDVEGKSFKLSDYRGKVVLLDFWGFW